MIAVFRLVNNFIFVMLRGKTRKYWNAGLAENIQRKILSESGKG
jgi:hypothetical protein